VRVTWPVGRLTEITAKMSSVLPGKGIGTFGISILRIFGFSPFFSCFPTKIDKKYSVSPPHPEFVRMGTRPIVLTKNTPYRQFATFPILFN
jgi:hypothetical protein